MINFNEFIKKEELAYYKIRSIKSILFLHQDILFDKKDFEHLTRKGKHRRKIVDQIRRLKYTTKILQDHKAVLTYRCFERKNTVTHLWGITSIIQDRKIKIIVQNFYTKNK